MDSTKASCWVNNKLRAHEEQWKEDDCTFCQCVDSEPHCTAMACKQSCQNPVKIPGECCPFCEGTLDAWTWRNLVWEAPASPRFYRRGCVSVDSLKGGRGGSLEPPAPLFAFITVAHQNETHLCVCVRVSVCVSLHNRSGCFLYASVISYSSLSCSSHRTCLESRF